MDAAQGETPAPAPIPRRMTSAQMLTYTKAFQPSRDEITGMLRQLELRKGWTRGYVAAICGVDTNALDKVERGVSKNGALDRCIWMLYMADVAPGVLTDPVSFATWGKVDHSMPPGREKPSAEEEERIIAWLRHEWARTTNRNLMNVNELRVKFNLSVGEVKRLTKAAGYVPVIGKFKGKQKKRTPSWLNPTSRYWFIDWSKKGDVLAAELGIARRNVVMMKARIRKVGAGKLRYICKQMGKPRNFFDPVFRSFRRGRIIPK